MRSVMTFAFVAGVALCASVTSSSAGAGHWYCTSDGIKSWTTESTGDSKGWSYSGDRSSYKDSGHCSKA
jgi:hypothetical protein